MSASREYGTSIPMTETACQLLSKKLIGPLLASVAAIPLMPLSALAYDAMDADATAGNPGGSSVVEEVMVTARRREESLQSTPISISAFTANKLEQRQILTTQDLGRFTPNLVTNQGQSVSGNSSAGSYFIRGIGQIDFLLNTDPGVGVYVDGVYIARAMGSIMDVVALERVEVLRGPQGTLFGRNTIGGAVSLTTQKPNDTFSAGLDVTVGSDDRHDLRATMNAPLTDQLFINGAVLWKTQDGYVHRVTDDTYLGEVDSISARTALRLLASDSLTFDLAFDFVRDRGTTPASNMVQINETAIFPGFYNGAIAGPPCVPPPSPLNNPTCFNSQWVSSDLFVEHGDFISRQKTDVFGVSFTGEWEVSDGLKLKSITGYRDTDALGNRDGDHTPILIQNTTDIWSHKQFSEEFQVIGDALDNRLTWIAGAYYFWEKGTNLSFVDFAVASFQSGGSVRNHNFALFGQFTYDITEKLKLTAGLRWTDDNKSFTPDTFAVEDRAGLFPPGTVPGFRLVPMVKVKTSEQKTTPMVNLAYAWTDELMTYFTFSKGFKSGGFTQRIFPPLPTVPSFGPESVDSYEIGLKLDAFNRRARLNIAGFYTDYSDLQVAVLEGVQPLIRNAASAEVQGFEIEFEAHPISTLRLEGGIGYTDAKYKSLGPTVLATGVTIDSKFPQIPKWTGNIGASYEFTLPAELTLTPRVDFIYQSATYMDAVNTPSLRQDAYGLLNAAIKLEGSSPTMWSVEFFGRNLTDKTYFTGGFGDLNVQGYAEVALARKREWGLAVRLRY